jgi:hypothetical protein
MKTFNLKMSLESTWCHDWPKLKIIANDQIVFDGTVQLLQELVFDLPLQDTNTLIIQHYDKKFGQNGQWDTISENGSIVQDRAIKLLSLCLDQIEINKYVTQKCIFKTEDGNMLHTDYWGFNGQLEISFGAPVYDWIIDTIVKHQTVRKLDLAQPIETSFDQLFEYEQDIKELDELEKIIKSHAHLLSKSSKI